MSVSMVEHAPCRAISLFPLVLHCLERGGGGPSWQLLTKPLDVNQDNMGWTGGGGVLGY